MLGESQLSNSLLTNYFHVPYRNSNYQNEAYMVDSSSGVTDVAGYYLINPHHPNYDVNTSWTHYNVDAICDLSKSFQYCSHYCQGHSLVTNSNLPVSNHGTVKQINTNKTGQIWRPFTPTPTQVDSSCLHESNNEDKMLDYFCRKPTLSPSLSTVKFGHSKTSLFIPVKKKSTVICNKCSLVFRSNAQLNNHVRLHKGCKPYVCDYPNCSKNFARNEELTRHKRIHSGYKPYVCMVCRKSFGRKDHLSKHLKTHLQASEKKVYICCVSGCGHRYTRSDALTRHKSTAHGNIKT